MQTIPLQKFLPGMSRLAYGCMGLGGAPGRANQVIDAALGAGINLFDHADIYTQGEAEAAFGGVLAKRPQLREQIYIQSKCAIRYNDDKGPKRYDFSSRWISQSVDGSLSRLNTEYLDILLLHRPDPLMAPEAVAETFTRLREVGKVRYLGVSNMSATQMQLLQSCLDAPLVTNQLEISLARLAWLDNTHMADTLVHCRLQGVQIQAWGALCQGMLSGRDLSAQPASMQHTAERVSELAKQHRVSKEAIVLAFLLRHPAAIQPLIGTTDLKRIQACAQALQVNLSREQWYGLYVCARDRALA